MKTETIVAFAIASVMLAVILAMANHELQVNKRDHEFRMEVLKTQGLVCTEENDVMICRQP